MLRKLSHLSEDLELLHQVTGVPFSWHFINADYLHSLRMDQTKCWCDFCNHVKGAPCFQLNRCLKLHRGDAFREALLKRGPFLLKCHAGGVLLAVPFFPNGELCGILFGGPSVLDPVCPIHEVEELYQTLPRKTESELLTLGSYLQRELHARLEDSTLPPLDYHLLPLLETADARILKAAHLMRKFCREKISAEQIARAAGMSVSSLLHKFREETSFSFSDWLQRLRVADAVRLVEGTDLTFNEIALLCHFPDQSRMTVLFRRYLNHSPGELRRRLKKRG